MAYHAVHTTQRGGRWFNEIERDSRSRIYSRHLDRNEAEATGLELARREGCPHLIHPAVGDVGSRHSQSEQGR